MWYEAPDGRIRATRHGDLRLKEGNWTVAEYERARSGRQYVQRDAARVYIHRTRGGRLHVIIEGEQGVVTAHKNLRNIDGLARSYGWVEVIEGND